MQQVPNPTSTTTLNIQILQFRPLGSVFPISVIITMPVPVPGITVHNNDITVKTNAPENLQFQITGSEYVFVGAAFETITPEIDVGADEYPLITMKRWGPGSPSTTLTVLDANQPKNRNKSFSYILLVQSTTTGAIGVIDPIIRNEIDP